MTDGSSPASAVLKDGNAVYTPGLSERRGSASKFYHGDALGSTRGITDSTQAVTDSQLYDAFGNTMIRTGSTPTPFGFVGKAQYQSDSARHARFGQAGRTAGCGGHQRQTHRRGHQSHSKIETFSLKIVLISSFKSDLCERNAKAAHRDQKAFWSRWVLIIWRVLPQRLLKTEGREGG